MKDGSIKPVGALEDWRVGIEGDRTMLVKPTDNRVVYLEEVTETKLQKVKKEFSTELISHPGKHLTFIDNRQNYCYYMYKTEVKMVDLNEDEANKLIITKDGQMHDPNNIY